MRRGERDDAGSVLLLAIGLAAVLLLLVAVVVDVSKVVLAKRALAAAADGAAVAAAQQADRASIVADGLGSRLPLDPQGVAAAVADYQAQAQQEQPGLELVGSVDAGAPEIAVVRARRVVVLPFVGWLGTAEVTVEGTARARSPVVP